MSGSTIYRHLPVDAIAHKASNNAMKRILAALLLVTLAAPAWAGWDEGVAAYDRGDYATALREFRVLAEQGDADAQFSLGDMYYSGYGVPQDNTEAVRWYRKAADQGDISGQDSLAIMYYAGWGVPQNYVQAHMWWNLAAALGHKYAAKKRAIVAAKMTAAQIAEAQRLAQDWKPKTQ